MKTQSQSREEQCYLPTGTLLSQVPPQLLCIVPVRNTYSPTNFPTPEYVTLSLKTIFICSLKTAHTTTYLLKNYTRILVLNYFSDNKPPTSISKADIPKKRQQHVGLLLSKTLRMYVSFYLLSTWLCLDILVSLSD